jgi:hypothetical protein
MIEDCSHCVRESKWPAGKASDGSIFKHGDDLPVTCRTRQTIGSEHECRSKATAPYLLEDAQKGLCGSRLCLILQFMDEGKIGHHHAKCLGPIHPAENLSANSF